MNASMVSLILNIVLLLFVFLGFVFGLGRGAKKSGVRTLWTLIFLVLAIIVAPFISKALMGIYIAPLENTLAGFIEAKIMDIPEIASVYESNPAMQALVAELPALLVNLVVVILLILLAMFFSWIAYLITKAVMNHKEKNMENKVYTVRNGRPMIIDKTIKPKKHRFWGGLIGAVGGFIVCFCLFLPVTGTVRTINQFIDPSTQPAVAMAEEETPQNQFEYAEVSKKLVEFMGEDVVSYLQAVNNSILVKATSLGNIDLMLYDTISTVTVSGHKVSLRAEANMIAHAYESVIYVQNMTDENGNIDFENLDFNKLSKSVDSILSSGLIMGIGMDVLEDYIAEAIDGTLIDDMANNGMLPEEYAPYAKILVNEINTAVGAGQWGNGLKHDVLAILEVAKAVVQSGLLDVVPNLTEFNKTAVQEVAMCLNGTHEQSQTANHDYLTDITNNLFKSTILKGALVGAFNIAVQNYLQEYLENTISADRQDITGTNAVVLSNATQENLDWAKVTGALNVVLHNGLDVAVFVLNAMDENNDIDPETLLADETLAENVGRLAIILDSISGLELFANTEDGENVLHQVLKNLNRVSYINKYVDLEKLGSVDWQDEFEPIQGLLTVASPALSTADKKTFAYKTLNYDLITAEDYIGKLFGGKLADAYKTTALYDDVVTHIGNDDIEQYLGILLEGTEKVSDLYPTMISLSNSVFNLAKAGVVEFALAEEITASTLNTLVLGLVSTAPSQSQSYFENAIDNLFASDKLTEVYVALINNFVEGQEGLADIGQIQTLANWTPWQTSVKTDLKTALKALMGVYLELEITDFEQLDTSTVNGVLDIILTDKFVGTDGHAKILGMCLDILTNSKALETTNETTTHNILREWLYDLMDGGDDFVDRNIVLSTTSQTFWQDELINIAPSLILLHTTYTDNTQTETLLENLLSGSMEDFVETDGFKALTNQQVEDLVSSLCQSKLLKPVAVELINELNKTIAEAFGGSVAVIPDGVDLGGQSQSIASVVSDAFTLINIEMAENATIQDELLTNFNLQVALKELLTSMKSNADNSGVFAEVFSVMFTGMKNTIDDINIQIIQMVNSTFNENTTLTASQLLVQYDQLLDIMIKGNDVLELGVESIDDVLESGTAEAKTALKELLNSLYTNALAEGVMTDAFNALFDQAELLISNANAAMIGFVEADYNGNLELSTDTFFAQYDSILNVLAKAKTVSDLGQSTLEDVLLAQGGKDAMLGLVEELQANANGVFGPAYLKIYGYVVDTYQDVVQSLNGAMSTTVDWASVLDEIADLEP